MEGRDVHASYLSPQRTFELDFQWKNLYLHHFGVCTYPPRGELNHVTRCAGEPQSATAESVEENKGTLLGILPPVLAEELQSAGNFGSAPWLGDGRDGSSQPQMSAGVAACARLQQEFHAVERQSNPVSARREGDGCYPEAAKRWRTPDELQSCQGGARTASPSQQQWHDSFPCDILVQSGSSVKSSIAPTWQSLFLLRQNFHLAPFLHFLTSDLRFANGQVIAVLVQFEDALRETQRRMISGFVIPPTLGGASSVSSSAAAPHHNSEHRREIGHTSPSSAFTDGGLGKNARRGSLGSFMGVKIPPPLTTVSTVEAVMEDMIILLERGTRTTLHAVGDCLQYYLGVAFQERKLGERDYAAMFSLTLGISEYTSIGQLMDDMILGLGSACPTRVGPADSIPEVAAGARPRLSPLQLGVDELRPVVYSMFTTNQPALLQQPLPALSLAREKWAHALQGLTHPLLMPILLLSSYIRLHGAAWCRPLMFSLIEFLGDPDFFLYLVIPDGVDAQDVLASDVSASGEGGMTEEQPVPLARHSTAVPRPPPRGPPPPSSGDHCEADPPVQGASMMGEPLGSRSATRLKRRHSPVASSAREEDVLDCTCGPPNAMLLEGAQRGKRHAREEAAKQLRDGARASLAQQETKVCANIKRAFEKFTDVLLSSGTLPAAIRHLLTTFNTAISEHMLASLLSADEREHAREPLGSCARLEKLLELACGNATADVQKQRASNNPLNGEGRRGTPPLSPVASASSLRASTSNSFAALGSSRRRSSLSPHSKAIPEKLVKANPIIRDIKFFRVAKFFVFDLYLVPMLRQAARFGLLPPNATVHMQRNLEAFVAYLEVFVHGPFSSGATRAGGDTSGFSQLIDTLFVCTASGQPVSGAKRKSADENTMASAPVAAATTTGAAVAPAPSRSMRGSRTPLKKVSSVRFKGTQRSGGDVQGNGCSGDITPSEVEALVAAKMQVRPFTATNGKQFGQLSHPLQRLNYDLGMIDSLEMLSELQSGLEESRRHLGEGSRINVKLNTFCWVCVDDFEESRVVEELMVTDAVEKTIVEALFNQLVQLSDKLGASRCERHLEDSIMLEANLFAVPDSLQQQQDALRHYRNGNSEHAEVDVPKYHPHSQRERHRQRSVVGWAANHSGNGKILTHLPNGYLSRLHQVLGSQWFAQRAASMALVRESHRTGHGASALAQQHHQLAVCSSDTKKGEEEEVISERRFRLSLPNPAATTTTSLQNGSHGRPAAASATMQRRSLAVSHFDFSERSRAHPELDSVMSQVPSRQPCSSTGVGTGGSSCDGTGGGGAPQSEPRSMWAGTVDELVSVAAGVFHECDSNRHHRQRLAIREEAKKALKRHPADPHTGGTAGKAAAPRKVGAKTLGGKMEPTPPPRRAVHPHSLSPEPPQRASCTTFITQGQEDARVGDAASVAGGLAYIPGVFNGMVFSGVNGPASLTRRKTRNLDDGSERNVVAQ